MVKWSHRVKKTFKIRLKLNSNCTKLCMICFGNYSTSSMFCSLLGDDLIVQGCSKFQWNESETLWLYSQQVWWRGRSDGEALPLSQDQMTETVSLWSCKQECDLSCQSGRITHERPFISAGGGWDVTTARRRLLLGSPWNKPRLAFISCLLATRTLRTEMQRWTVVCFRPNLWHLTCDENL